MPRFGVSFVLVLAVFAYDPARAAVTEPLGPLTQLHASAVPVLLPRRLPPTSGALRSIAVLDAGAHGYYVGYSAVAGCAGALSCAHIHIAGFVDPHADLPQPHDRRIHLGDGSMAWYRPRDCTGASCTQASLTFRRSQATYEIDAAEGSDDLRTLTELYAALRPLR